MKRHVLPFSVLPTRFPIQTTAVVYLLCDRFHVPGWAWGVVGTIMALYWLAAILLSWTEQPKPLAGYGEKS